MRKTFLQPLKFMAFLAAGIILLWLAFRKTDFTRLAADLKDADYSWLLLSILFGFLAYASRARRWNLLINPLGYRPSFSSAFHAMMTGYLANLALPRIGELTRCVALGKKENIPVDQLFGTVVIERTIDLISLLLIMIFLLFTGSDKAGEFLRESIILPVQQRISGLFGETRVIWAAVALLSGIALIAFLRFRNDLKKIRFFAKIFAVSKGILNGLKSITNLEHKWEFIFHTVFIWINYALMTWVIVFALESTSHITFPQSIFLLVIGGLAMSAPVQGGLGIFHYTLSRGLAIMGVPLEDGLVYALLAHESQLIFIAIVGAISFLLIFRKEKPVLPDPVDLASKK